MSESRSAKTRAHGNGAPADVSPNTDPRPRQWRSLAETEQSDEFRRWLEDEFPERASLLNIDRRSFMKYMGASMALAGLTGCRYLPQQHVLPMADAPEDAVPGIRKRYASAVTHGGLVTGVVGTCHEGRPVKLEGNPLHPASLGATDALTQAALLDLYDPERMTTVTNLGAIRPWDDFLAAGRSALDAQIASQGRGVRILSGATTSPTLRYQIARLLERLPRARWSVHEPIHRDNVLEGAVLAYGEAANTHYRLDAAEVVVAFDADFLTQMPGSVRYARDFMSRRRPTGSPRGMARLYCAESSPTNTGATADHRLPLRARDIEVALRYLARKIGLPIEAPEPDASTARMIGGAAADLLSSRGRGVVIVGDTQPAEMHALAHSINESLGNTGATVMIGPPLGGAPAPTQSLAGLCRDLAAGDVDVLLVLECNPAYDAPADHMFADVARKARFMAVLAPRMNETTDLAHWAVPASHAFETWSDGQAFEGTFTIAQPLVSPLFDTRSSTELLAALCDRPRGSYELVRAAWRERLGATTFEARWRRAVHDGIVAGLPSDPMTVTVRPDVVRRLAPFRPTRDTGLELIIQPDPTVWDGRHASNGWLQELPKPITRLTWDNAALVGPSTAQRLSLRDGDVVDLRLGGRSVTAPVKLVPGHPSGSITVHLGGGRRRAGEVGTGVGFDAYAIRFSDRQWFTSGAEITKTGARYAFATTEQHHAISGPTIDGTQGRDIVRIVSAEAPGHGNAHGHTQEHPSIYAGKDHQYDGYAWGMAIDLSLCTGCNACVTACQAENNIPVVGREQVAKGREMHWIRVDRYFQGDVEQPDIHHQPVLCMHCEEAPCEPVCPVAATVHSHEGLNQMVYNRCVGTRYCSNNCPYKVRRFNFLNYANHHDVPIKKLLHNPDVTVRGRGVMEKCTFCVQRINVARIEAKKAGRPIRDGEIVTACQAACPPRAIVFGDIRDPMSAVSRAKREQRNYSLLGELNTKPRLTYLAKVRNRSSVAEDRHGA